MKSIAVREALQILEKDSSVVVQGWVRNKRMSKRVVFIMLQDGSSPKPLQIVVDRTIYPEDFFVLITIGSSIAVQGTVVLSQGKGQNRELQAQKVTLLGESLTDAYPLQPKHHSAEFLRTIQHLRFRTNIFGAIFRLRHAISYATHHFFHKKGFYYIHTPIITSLDAEGAGQLFGIDSNKKKSGSSFFGKPTYLTVSGQLAAEAATLALGKVYSFAPSFRAENSNTTHHLSEFWMIEPEVAFYDLKDCIDLAEELIKYLIGYVLNHYQEELVFLEKHHASVSTNGQSDLCKQLEVVCERAFMRITYDQAFDLLKEVSVKDPHRFVYPMHSWGRDLQTEHERYLSKHFQKCIVVTDYPKGLKPFYMRENDDAKTVACMDVLLPGVGEVAGGSQREERYERLVEAMKYKKMDLAPLAWYLDTRRFGSVIHSGFGLGLDRLVQFITGVENIRDTIPFPRTPGHAAC